MGIAQGWLTTAFDVRKTVFDVRCFVGCLLDVLFDFDVVLLDVLSDVRCFVRCFVRDLPHVLLQCALHFKTNHNYISPQSAPHFLSGLCWECPLGQPQPKNSKKVVFGAAPEDSQKILKKYFSGRLQRMVNK